MWLPGSYAVVLAVMLLSMLCWGSWDNTQKLARGWRFELFYWDYMIGIVVSAAAFALTLGRTHPAAAGSFFANLAAASPRALLWALLGGAVFNLGNLLLVAAISIAGMAVAFPIGSGLALVIGGVLNYLLRPAGNPWLLFGGIALVGGAIASDAAAYKGLRGRTRGAGRQGIALSLMCGVVIGLFYPLVVKAMSGSGALGPYAVFFVFALGALASNFVFNSVLMRRPVTGAPLTYADYRRGGWRQHRWGILGGLIWASAPWPATWPPPCPPSAPPPPSP